MNGMRDLESMENFVSHKDCIEPQGIGGTKSLKTFSTAYSLAILVTRIWRKLSIKYIKLSIILDKVFSETYIINNRADRLTYKGENGMDLTIDYNRLISEISGCCLTERVCGKCKKDQCLVGYSIEGIKTCLKDKNDFLENGMEGIPYSDIKIYDTEAIVKALAALLHQCRNCNVYHDEECVINIVRSTFEVILFGEPLEYGGSTLMYLSEIREANQEIAQHVFDVFQQSKP